MNRWWIYPLGFVLFLLLCVIALLICPLAIFLSEVKGERRSYPVNVLLAMDRLGATTLGCSGKYTISAECAVRKDRLFCWLRKILDRIEAEHCATAARNEGLL
jgi:hypothetical protein